MSKKARVILLTITVVLTSFTFVFMSLTRPGHSEFAQKVLESAAARQSQPLAEIKEPLETDTEVLSAEAKMAESVAEILKSDSSFNKHVADTAKAETAQELESWKKSVKSEILTDVNNIMSSYSLDEYIPRLEAEITASIDDRFSSISNDLDIRFDSSASAANAYSDDVAAKAIAEAEAYADNASSEARTESMSYADESVKSSADEIRAYIDENAIDADAIAKEIVNSLGISAEPEYADAVKRIVNEAIESALTDSRVYEAAADLVEAKHNELMAGYAPAVIAEPAKEQSVEPIAEESPAAVPAVEEAAAIEPAAVEEASAQSEPAEEESTLPSVPDVPVVTEVKTMKISAPSFGEPKQELTTDEYKAERSQRRSEQLSLLEKWLSGNNQ